jgi:hypothetical protein
MTDSHINRGSHRGAGHLPDGAEAALLDVTICTDLELQIGSPNAEVRRCHDALEYLCGHLRDHVKKLRSAVYGDPDDDDNSNGADLAA